MTTQTQETKEIRDTYIGDQIELAGTWVTVMGKQINYTRTRLDVRFADGERVFVNLLSRRKIPFKR